MNQKDRASQQALGRRVENLRDLRGWSQQVLADRLELERTYLGEIERGDGDPTLNTLKRIADCFGVSFSELLNELESV